MSGASGNLSEYSFLKLTPIFCEKGELGNFDLLKAIFISHIRHNKPHQSWRYVMKQLKESKHHITQYKAMKEMG